MFSELIDKVRQSSKTSGTITTLDYAGYLNNVIRELQVVRRKPTQKDRKQIELVVESVPVTHTFDRNFRRVEFVSYDRQIPVEAISPSAAFLEKSFAYYMVDNTIEFKGVDVGSTIQISYFAYVPRLSYYEEGERPAVYDRNKDSWTYLNDANEYVDTLGDSDEEAERRKLVGNWLLRDWENACRLGLYSEIYRDTDDPRAPKYYSGYQSVKESVATEAARDSEGI